MKQYVITESELTALHERVEKVKLRKVEMLPSNSPERTMAQEMFRSFNFEVCSWINDISR